MSDNPTDTHKDVPERSNNGESSYVRPSLKNICLNVFVMCLVFLLIGVTCYTNKIQKVWKADLNAYNVHLQDEAEIYYRIDAIMTLFGYSKFEAETYSRLASKFPGEWSKYLAMLYSEDMAAGGKLISSAGCKGRAQLKDSTFKEMCEQLNIRYSSQGIWNDINNVAAGFQYLSNGIKASGDSCFRYYISGPNWKVIDPKAKAYQNQYNDFTIKNNKLLNLVYLGLKHQSEEEANASIDSAKQAATTNR